MVTTAQTSDFNVISERSLQSFFLTHNGKTLSKKMNAEKDKGVLVLLCANGDEFTFPMGLKACTADPKDLRIVETDDTKNPGNTILICMASGSGGVVETFSADCFA
jgi:hypothetical protein